MNRVVRGVVSLVVAAGLATGSAVVATTVLHDRRADAVAEQTARQAPDARSDRVANALDGLADDGVYVAPDARDMLDRRGERKVARAIARARTSVKVVVWSRTYHAGAGGFDLRMQLEAGLQEAGGPGVYLIWEGPESGDVDTFGGNGYLTLSPHEVFAGDPAVTIPALVKRIDREVTWRATNDDFDYWGGPGGGFAAGLLISGGGLVVLALVYGLLVVITKRRLPGGWRW